MKRHLKGARRLLRIESIIRIVRDERIILDSDLAGVYGIPTFRLNEAVKRNRTRFPDDFMFQLSKENAEGLTSQIAISKRSAKANESMNVNLNQTLLSFKSALHLPFRLTIAKKGRNFVQ